MKVLKGNFGEVRFCDNMDKEYGLPSLKPKSFELCLTDVPYAQKIQHKNGVIGGDNHAKCIIFPKINDEPFTQTQFNLIQQITNNQIIFGGNYYSFLPFTPTWYIWDKRIKNIQDNDQADGEMAWTSFDTSVRIFHFLWKGFIATKKEERTHPFQKPMPLWYWLHEKTKPLSILDPYIGSGPTVELCEEYGVYYLGYEIMESLYDIVEDRLKKGQGKHQIYLKQKTHQSTLGI
jgi:DNA modification methylase